MIGDPQPCAVCGETVSEYAWHARLACAICFHCPLTDVKGEDVTMHTMQFVRTR